MSSSTALSGSSTLAVIPITWPCAHCGTAPAHPHRVATPLHGCPAGDEPRRAEVRTVVEVQGVQRRALGTRLVLALGAVGLVVAAVLARHHLPSVSAVQDGVLQLRGLGPGLPVAFVLVHAVVTVTPVPRTAFTLAAGVLFGPVEGVVLTVLGATASAVLALLAVRAVGRDAVAARLQHPALRSVDTRLAHRGWLTVASMRLVPVVPFWVVNYACGVSSVRVLPFALATAVAVVPGTVSLVLLGRATSGHTSPWVLGVGVACGLIGLVGLVLDLRTPVNP